MVTLTLSTTLDSVKIEREGKHIGYLHCQKETEARIELLPAFAELTISETKAILKYYENIEIQKEFSEKLALSIDDLDISVRLHLALSEMGIKTVGDIINQIPRFSRTLGAKSSIELVMIMKGQCNMVFSDGKWTKANL